MKKKIAIDVQTTSGEKTGFGNYVENLVDRLKVNDKNNDYLLISPKTEKDFSAPQRFIWDQIKVPFISTVNRVDLLHQPAFSAPVFYRGKIVVTVHDLIAVYFGADIPFWSSQFFGRWMPFSYRFADHIIAVSENTKKDIIKLLKIKEDKITVIYEAADKKFAPISNKKIIDKIKNKYNLGNEYILHVGTLNPRKNIGFLIDVFSQVVKKMPNYKLAITGKKGWYYDGIIRKVKNLKLEKNVVFVGYIAEEDKVALYAGAKLLAFPSLYEGFGLPILEAMSCGVPVISSDRSSMPELVGDAGVLLAPDDEKGWVVSMLKILQSEKYQKTLAAKSLQQVKKFNWDITAKKTIEVYEKLLKK